MQISALSIGFSHVLDQFSYSMKLAKSVKVSNSFRATNTTSKDILDTFNCHQDGKGIVQCISQHKSKKSFLLKLSAFELDQPCAMAKMGAGVCIWRVKKFLCWRRFFGNNRGYMIQRHLCKSKPRWLWSKTFSLSCWQCLTLHGCGYADQGE
jgi:hypothetical protein